jgi:tetratricopeptide (TPR) repeat protein
MKSITTCILALFFLLQICNPSLSNNINSAYSGEVTDTVKFNRKDKRIFNNAIYFIYLEEYQKALPLFKKLLKKDPENSSFNFFSGLCYLNLRAPKSTIKPYFAKAILQTAVDYNDNIEERGAPVFAFYYQAQLYMLDNRFDEAYNDLIRFKSLIPSSSNKLSQDVSRMTDICKYAKIFTSNPMKNVVIEPFDELNTTFYDYGTQITSDGNTIYFSSKRRSNLGKIGTDGQYKSDIYSITKVNGKWSNAIPFKAANSKKNDNFCCISADGNTLFFSSDIENDLYDIYYCKKSADDVWSSPVKLENTINSKANESYAWLSQNGKTLYFVSDKKGGYGGRDIYFSEKLDNGTWRRAENMGNTINTPYDEKSPFITEDGKSIYFSSRGHNTIGGFDVFYSKLENGKWTEPVNLGCPINTSYDDQYFNISNDGKTILYSSAKKGLDGTTDIFTVTNFNIDSTREITGLLCKNISSDTALIGKNKIFENDTIYTVQVAAGKNLKISEFNTLYGIKECTGKDGVKRYVIGEFNNKLEAESLRSEMIRLGFGDAWIPSIDEFRIDCK